MLGVKDHAGCALVGSLHLEETLSESLASNLLELSHDVLRLTMRHRVGQTRSPATDRSFHEKSTSALAATVVSGIQFT